MKNKIYTIILGLLTIVLITGCKTNEQIEQTLVCTTTENEDGMDTLETISMTYKNNKLNHMKMEVDIKITDSTVKDNWEVFKSTMDEENKEFTKDGVSLKVSTDDQNYEYKTTLDIDVLNASEEILKEQGFDGLKDDTSTIESSKEDAEKDGAICEIK